MRIYQYVLCNVLCITTAIQFWLVAKSVVVGGAVFCASTLIVTVIDAILWALKDMRKDS